MAKQGGVETGSMFTRPEVVAERLGSQRDWDVNPHENGDEWNEEFQVAMKRFKDRGG